MTWIGIFQNLCADFLFLAISIGFGWIAFSAMRRGLLKFFGVDTSKRIVIYLSNLTVIRGGTAGIDGRQRSYEGTATAFGETQVASRFRDLFNYFLPSLSDKPGFLSSLLISDVQVQFLPSPSGKGQVEGSSSFIALGSPAYNAASGLIEERFHPRARFDLGDLSNHLPVARKLRDTQVHDLPLAESSDSPAPTGTFLSTAGSPRPLDSAGTATYFSDKQNAEIPASPSDPVIVVDGVPPFSDTTVCFVQRLIDPEQDRCVFYVAGLLEVGTVGAAYYLATKWKQLQRQYGDRTNFLVMLHVEPADYTRTSVIFEARWPTTQR